MPTDWDHFRKIAEEPDVDFLDLPAWVRGYSSEMVRHASRPDGRLARDARLIGVLLRVKDDEREMLESAVRKLLEIGFLVEREGCLWIRNFKLSQQSKAAKKQAKYREKQAEDPLPRVTESDRVLPPVTSRDQALPNVTVRREEKREEEIPPNPPNTEPASPRKLKTLPGPDAPVAERAKRFDRDPASRTFLGDPREWVEFRLILAEYGKRFGSTPKLSEYARDKRVRSVVAALIDYTPDQIRLAIREASRSDFKEDRFRQLDCVLHDGAKIDSWLESAPQSLREAAARNALAENQKRVRDPVAAEQTASENVPMPAELIGLAARIGTGGA